MGGRHFHSHSIASGKQRSRRGGGKVFLGAIPNAPFTISPA